MLPRLALLAACLGVAALRTGTASAAVVNENPAREVYALRMANLVQASSSLSNDSLIGVVPVYGTPECDYSAAMTLGSTTFLMTIDTGSANNAIASSSCTTCGTSKGYTSTTSSSSTFTVSYGTASDASSWTGYLAVVSSGVTGVGNITQKAMQADISIIVSQNAFFQSSCTSYTQGILGLGYERIAQHGSVSYADLLANSNAPDGFSLELCPPKYPVSGTQRTGNWWIGGYPSSHLTDSMVFTPITDKAYYGVNLEGLSLGSTVLSVSKLSSPRAIVDSGTSGLIFSSDNYAVVVAAMKSQSAVAFTGISATVQSQFWAGYTLSGLTSAQFKLSTTAILYLQMQNMDNTGTVSVPIKPSEYVHVYGPDGNGLYTMTLLVFSSGATSGSGNVGTIIGLPAHLNKLVFYDRGPNARIGFAESTACSSMTSTGLPTPSVSALDTFSPRNTYASGATGLIGAGGPSAVLSVVSVALAAWMLAF